MHLLLLPQSSLHPHLWKRGCCSVWNRDGRISGVHSSCNSDVLCHLCPVYPWICSVQRLHREHSGCPGYTGTHCQDEPLSHAGGEAGGAHPGESFSNQGSPEIPLVVEGEREGDLSPPGAGLGKEWRKMSLNPAPPWAWWSQVTQYHFFFPQILLKYSWFTMLCLISAVQQRDSVMYFFIIPFHYGLS